MIQNGAITTLHSIIIHKTPIYVTNLLTNVNNNRTTKEITTKYIPRTDKYQKFFLYSRLTIYNNIPENLKSPQIFKIKTKSWLQEISRGVPDTFSPRTVTSSISCVSQFLWNFLLPPGNILKNSCINGKTNISNWEKFVFLDNYIWNLSLYRDCMTPSPYL